MRRRFFDDQPFTQDQPVTLGAGPSHHIAKVLRMNPGDELTLFNGRGGEWSAVLESVGKKSVTARPLAFHERDRTAPVPVTLGLPLIKGDRMDYALQKATELGVAAIRVLDTERTEVRLKGERAAKKADHWWQVVISACEQCGLNRPPALDGPLPLKDFLAAADGLALIAHPGRRPGSRRPPRRHGGDAADRAGRGFSDPSWPPPGPRVSCPLRWASGFCARKPRPWPCWHLCGRDDCCSECLLLVRIARHLRPPPPTHR